MYKNTKKFDAIIIGGGAAGMMAAISAKRNHPEMSVALLDQTFALGRKILVSGSGRCNITNANLDAAIEKKYYGANTDFVKNIFSQFAFKEIVNFFEDLGIELYVEKKTEAGKMFPITDQAKTVVTLLEDEVKESGVEIFLNSSCQKVMKKGEIFITEVEITKSGSFGGDHVNFESKYLIAATGGRTYPALGSDGSGYGLAESFGHNIITPIPSGVPLLASNPLSQELQGVKMEVEAISIIDKKEIRIVRGDILFTQYGLSGSAILELSREISIYFNRDKGDKAAVRINFFPGKTAAEVRTIFEKRWQKRPHQTIEKTLYGYFPPKIPPVLLRQIGIPKDREVGNMTETEKKLLCDRLTGYEIKVTGTRSWNEAEFTAGGVDTSEVKKKTLESNIVLGLFFCGEILDVDGGIGGYNLSWAWSSGWVAGKLQ